MEWDKITVCLDMAGCPNRCIHCWLGFAKSGRLTLDDLVYTASAFRPHAKELSVSSWFREPDYLSNYRELYEAEKRLSSFHTPHFELMSFWRAARDPEYVPWLHSLGVSACQLTLFGKEETTDFHCGRKGAFLEILKAADLLMQNGIAPRFQIFIHQENAIELPYLEELFREKRYEKRTGEIGRDFSVFIHQGSCDREDERLYGIRVTKRELNMIPPAFVDSTLKHFQKENLQEVFGRPESELYLELLEDHSTRDLVSQTPVFYVDNDLNAYPNVSEPTRWWKLGNLKTDGCEAVLMRYAKNDSFAQRTANTVQLSVLAKECGDPDSQRLFLTEDYIMHLLARYLKREEAKTGG